MCTGSRCCEVGAHQTNPVITSQVIAEYHGTETNSSSNPTQVINQVSDPKLVEKGRKVLNSDLLTDDGRVWLTRALDPFHDSQLKPVGYPDLDISATVVQEINMTMTIKAPSTLADGETYDAHIFNLSDFACPLEDPGSDVFDLCNFNMRQGKRQTPYYTVAGYNVKDCGVAYVVGKTGCQFFPNGVSGPSAGCEGGGVHPGQYIQDKCRLVGGGFEVVNTTATLYQQGLVTCYRMPQINELGLTRYKYLDSTNDFTSSHVPCKFLAMPPNSAAEALVLPASKQWSATRGAYVVFAMNNMTNNYSGVDPVPRVYLSNLAPSNLISGTTCIVGGLHTRSNTDGEQDSYILNGAYFAPYDVGGAYFTGLSKQTTLQVTVKWLVESVPGPRSAFATLAEPSPQSDPEALRLYSEMISKLPVGVPVDENPDGEWFDSILGTLGDLAGAASVIHPAFGLVSRGLGVARQVVPRMVDSLAKQKQQQQQKKVKQVTFNTTRVVSPKSIVQSKAPTRLSMKGRKSK